jgi:hypothetical protein
VTIVADDGQRRSTRSFEIDVVDTIEPPEPVVEQVSVQAGYTRIKLSQITDDYLDSPGHAGRSFEAYVTVPDGASARYADAGPALAARLRVAAGDVGLDRRVSRRAA